jgi:uncharacterized protein with HEPN domain
MARDDSPDLRYVTDLIEACQKIITFTDGYVEADFRQNELVWSAVAYQMIVLGEAAKRLSLEAREQNRDVQWKYVVRMRDILCHKYDRLNLGEVWRTARGDVPVLLVQLSEIQSTIQL